MFVVMLLLLVLPLRFIAWLASRFRSIAPVARAQTPSGLEALPQQNPLARIHAPTPRLTI